MDGYGFGLSHNNIFTFSYRNKGFSLGRLENNMTFISPKYLIDKNNLSPVASFKTNSQEIVYVGDIEITTSVDGWFKGKMHFEIKDNFESALKDFRKNYPQFKSKVVVKRLVSLGSFVDANGNAKFSVAPHEFFVGRFKDEKK